MVNEQLSGLMSKWGIQKSSEGKNEMMKTKVLGT